MLFRRRDPERAIDVQTNMQTIRSFEEARDYILGIPKFKGKNSLENTKAFYQYLGCPGSGAKVVHIAGTNGKGSVSAYMASILQAAGFRTGMFTSPHLVSICERMSINGEQIGEDAFLLAFQKMTEALLTYQAERQQEYHPSFFEALFFMACIWFEQEHAEYIVMETGLGGRLDATNVIDHKEVCVITKIGLDHTEYLGNTIAQIAWEKSGILRSGVPVVFYEYPGEATGVIKKEAEKCKAPSFPVDESDITFLNFKGKSIDFLLRTRYYGYVKLSLHTIAHYQVENAAIAVRAVEQLTDHDRITAEMIIQGIAQMTWSGRMEEILPNVYIDGAHNPDGIEAFLETVRACDGRKHLLFAVVNDKDYSSMIRMLTQDDLFEDYTVTRIQGSREVSLDVMKDLFGKNTNKPVRYYEDAREAFEDCCRNSYEGESVFAAGSLYLAGLLKEYVV